MNPSPALRRTTLLMALAIPPAACDLLAPDPWVGDYRLVRVGSAEVPAVAVRGTCPSLNLGRFGYPLPDSILVEGGSLQLRADGTFTLEYSHKGGTSECNLLGLPSQRVLSGGWRDTGAGTLDLSAPGSPPTVLVGSGAANGGIEVSGDGFDVPLVFAPS